MQTATFQQRINQAQTIDDLSMIEADARGLSSSDYTKVTEGILNRLNPSPESTMFRKCLASCQTFEQMENMKRNMKDFHFPEKTTVLNEIKQKQKSLTANEA